MVSGVPKLLMAFLQILRHRLEFADIFLEGLDLALGRLGPDAFTRTSPLSRRTDIGDIASIHVENQ